MTVMFAILASVPDGAAKELVLHAGAEAPIDRVSQALGIDPQGLEARRPEEVFAAVPPMALSGRDIVTLSPCAGAPAANEDLKSGIERARSALGYMHFEEAREHVAFDSFDWSCLLEPAERFWVAEWFYLHGVVSAELGDVAAAKESFGIALSFVPDMTWDPGVPPTQKPVFIEARDAAQQTTSFEVEPSSATVLVDGGPLSAGELRHGQHYVQTDRYSGWIEVRQATTLVLGDSLGSDLVERAAEPRGRVMLGALLDELPPQRVHVVGPNDVWTRNAEGEWSRALVPSDLRPQRRQRGRATALVAGGSSLVLVGGAMTLYGTFASLSSSFEVDSAEMFGEDASDEKRVHRRNVTILWSGIGAGAVGTGLVVAGISMSLDAPGVVLSTRW